MNKKMQGFKAIMWKSVLDKEIEKLYVVAKKLGIDREAFKLITDSNGHATKNCYRVIRSAKRIKLHTEHTRIVDCAPKGNTSKESNGYLRRQAKKYRAAVKILGYNRIPIPAVA